MYDLIGDIHGHADELEQLLEALGYQKANGVYRHPERRVIFLGDFIDRGPKIRQVLQMVRPMIEAGSALAVIGNHELNAIAFHTEDPESPGEYLRRHTSKHKGQLRRTIEQLTPDELTSHLQWFRTLPLFLDLDGVRAVHACWDQQAITKIAQALDEHRGITTAFLHAAYSKKNPLFRPVDFVLKGKDAPLPAGVSIRDKDGGFRTEVSTRWYLSPAGHTYRTYALQTEQIDCDLDLEESVHADAAPYPADAKPVFVGHYWLSAPRPEILADNVACLDYSVAKNGFLCAYRWQREQKLDNGNFVWVRAKKE
jgi:diadenosine tetraphosphatase ApaH/serine/threonine PP2A family protein phosphatase